MKILWLPHTPWERCQGQREGHLLHRLKERHECHVITWEHRDPADRWYYFKPASYGRSLRAWTREDKGIRVHQVPRFHDLVRLATQDYSKVLGLNERWLRGLVRRLVRQCQIDVVICSTGHYAVGFPPFDLAVPLVFDYLDFYTYEQIERVYLEHADAVLCVSHVLFDRCRERHPRCFYLPNGVSLQRIREGRGDRVRAELGLNGSVVVSLIGLTCSERLFFVEAIELLVRRSISLKLLLVGNGPVLPHILKKARECRVGTISTGWVEPERIPSLLAATDIGIYPGEKDAYYDGACPLKVLEYTAAHRPVVATDLQELRRLSFPNVLLAEPTSEDFAAKLHAAKSQECGYPDMRRFDWDHLTNQLERILCQLV